MVPLSPQLWELADHFRLAQTQLQQSVESDALPKKDKAQGLLHLTCYSDYS